VRGPSGAACRQPSGLVWVKTVSTPVGDDVCPLRTWIVWLGRGRRECFGGRCWPLLGRVFCGLRFEVACDRCGRADVGGFRLPPRTVRGVWTVVAAARVLFLSALLSGVESTCLPACCRPGLYCGGGGRVLFIRWVAGSSLTCLLLLLFGWVEVGCYSSVGSRGRVYPASVRCGPECVRKAAMPDLLSSVIPPLGRGVESTRLLGTA
jgi:hypothetical protein